MEPPQFTVPSPRPATPAHQSATDAIRAAAQQATTAGEATFQVTPPQQTFTPAQPPQQTAPVPPQGGEFTGATAPQGGGFAVAGAPGTDMPPGQTPEAQTPATDHDLPAFKQWSERKPVTLADGTVIEGVPGEPEYPLPQRVIERKGEVARDRYGRYIVPDPTVDTGGAPTAHSRATTVSGSLKGDGGGLTDWKIRNTVTGLLAHPVLLSTIDKSLIGTENEWKLRDQITQVAEAAQTASGSADGRLFGDAVHAWTEDIDLGLATLEDVPEVVREHVAVIVAECADQGITLPAEYVERVVWNPTTNAVGTMDRIARLADGSLVIADIKTSSNITYSWLEMSAQLAQYATAGRMLSRDLTHWEPMPQVRQDIGLILHAPAIPKEGRQVHCDLYIINLAYGAEAMNLAALLRKAKQLAARSVPVNKHVGTIDPDTALVQAKAIIDGRGTSVPPVSIPGQTAIGTGEQVVSGLTIDVPAPADFADKPPRWHEARSAVDALSPAKHGDGTDFTVPDQMAALWNEYSDIWDEDLTRIGMEKIAKHRQATANAAERARKAGMEAGPQS